jgi:hypothetical protein
VTDIRRTPNHQGAPPVVGDLASFPSHAALARSLTDAGGHGTLSTLTPDGHPYGSLVAFVAADDGTPYLLASELAEHSRNAHREARAGLFVAAADVPDDADRLARPRVTLLGGLAPFDASPDDRDRYLERHPQAQRYVDFPDFSWWRLHVARVRYVGGFGVMSWVDGHAFRAATADPVVNHADGILAHMNDDHADACLLYARHLAGAGDATAATAVGVDRHGFTLWAETPAGPQVARVAFGEPVDSARAVRAAAVDLVSRARQRAAADGA